VPSAPSVPAPFAKPATLIETAISSHAFPSAVIEAGRRDSVIWRQAFGRLTYVSDAPVTAEDTIFDLASLTKVIAATTLVMRAVDADVLNLDDRVADRLPAWRGTDREAVTVRDLLEHASGLTAYLPFFRDHQGREEFERSICTLPLEYAPRTQSIYSDLGFMLLGFILEDANGAPLADQFERLRRDVQLSQNFRLKPEATKNGERSRGLADHSRGEGGQAEDLLAYNPPRDWRPRTAPTELDLWRGRLLQGEVHDENTWALGGAAGHSGLFGTAAAVGAFARLILKGLEGDTTLARAETLVTFATRSDVPGSSRALGWDTMLTSSSCGTRLSPRAIGHTGFTGTSLWIDPEQDLYIVLLTNRVHPARDNNAIQPVRRNVHDAIVDAVTRTS
jgi:CubicO group peptidase (beta-lactamase class C family)